jgi:hypothetical protein
MMKHSFAHFPCFSAPARGHWTPKEIDSVMPANTTSCRRLGMLMTALLATHGSGCDGEQPPSRQAVEQAWSRADRTAKQAAEAERQLRHERRLRDIDRLRSNTEIADLEARLHTLRGLSITLTLALLASIVWLAVEIRRRRILSAAMHNIVETQGETPRNPTNAPESDSGSSPP